MGELNSGDLLDVARIFENRVANGRAEAETIFGKLQQGQLRN